MSQDLQVQERCAELLAQNRPRIRRTVSAYLRDDSDVEDAVQEACVQAWKGAEALRNPDAFPFWIESIARNVCLALLRRKRAYRSALSDFAVNAQPATWTQHADTHIIVHGKVRYRNDRLRGMLVVRLDDDWERMVPVSPDGAFTFPILS